MMYQSFIMLTCSFTPVLLLLLYSSSHVVVRTFIVVQQRTLCLLYYAVCPPLCLLPLVYTSHKTRIQLPQHAWAQQQQQQQQQQNTHTHQGVGHSDVLLIHLHCD